MRWKNRGSPSERSSNNQNEGSSRKVEEDRISINRIRRQQLIPFYAKVVQNVYREDQVNDPVVVHCDDFGSKDRIELCSNGLAGSSFNEYVIRNLVEVMRWDVKEESSRSDSDLGSDDYNSFLSEDNVMARLQHGPKYVGESSKANMGHMMGGNLVIDLSGAQPVGNVSLSQVSQSSSSDFSVFHIFETQSLDFGKRGGGQSEVIVKLRKGASSKKSVTPHCSIKSHSMKTRKDKNMLSSDFREIVRGSDGSGKSYGRWNLEAEVSKVIEKGVFGLF
ncbi:hypothetical protein LWI28_011229 [Acer negundo]|uniref:Uncharacterized protein n=1 Tax=Acer negundo TaxID=4023 RepID=A0AAD5IZM4_ACENE|nr:hypothetical protein LWI28_011229 [Acer negundo]